MEPADWNRVLIADFAAERTRLGETNMMRLLSAFDHQMTHGCEASNLRCSLRRARMVFAATRRWRAPAVPGRMIVAAGMLSVGETKGFSPGEADPSDRAGCDCPWEVRGRHFVRRKPFAEGGVKEVSVGNRERVLGREVS
jgi:hypothetical protein